MDHSPPHLDVHGDTTAPDSPGAASRGFSTALALAITLLGLVALVASGCRTAHADRAAHAVLEPTEGNDVRGQVEFTTVADGVKIRAVVKGLPPGLHGFHVHEKGDCSAPDGTSAGGHFNPHGSPHGSPLGAEPARHAGDLGNLISSGVSTDALYERIDPLLSLDGEASIIGKAVIVHAGEDDLKSQPTGKAGARVACGVIKVKD